MIHVTAHDPSFRTVPRGLRTLARSVGLLHTTTKAKAIEAFLLLASGEPCTVRQRAESERILRLQPFLADATVRAVPDCGGGVRIEVETTDEIPTVFAMRFRGATPAALRFGNGNVGGQGLYLAAGVERGFAYRDGIGVFGSAYQVLGRPSTLAFAAERAPLGSTLTLALGPPFFTDLQRVAWHVGYSDQNGYLTYELPEGDALSLGVRRDRESGACLRGSHGSGILFLHGDVHPHVPDPIEPTSDVADAQPTVFHCQSHRHGEPEPRHRGQEQATVMHCVH
jgi:hypothetical protein